MAARDAGSEHGPPAQRGLLPPEGREDDAALARRVAVVEHKAEHASSLLLRGRPDIGETPLTYPYFPTKGVRLCS
jgi:hypothetical protein